MLLPHPLHICIDSRAVHDKAMKLIRIADEMQHSIDAKHLLKHHPLHRPWQIQVDGDLLALFWQGVNDRGLASITFTKVKGHATQAHVEEGITTAEHLRGNTNADTAATCGTRSHRDGLVPVADWFALRAKTYRSFMRKIQKILLMF